TKHMVSDKRISKSNGSSHRRLSERTPRRLAVCLEASEPDLRRGAVYELFSDKKAASHGYVRVIDDSGEDYLYLARFFLPIRLTKAAQQALMKALPRSTGA